MFSFQNMSQHECDLTTHKKKNYARLNSAHVIQLNTKYNFSFSFCLESDLLNLLFLFFWQRWPVLIIFFLKMRMTKISGDGQI
jgi:hypothetical protein